MKKILFVMCFLATASLFADSSDYVCSSVVFKDNYAYIKVDVVPVVKSLCDRYGLNEPVCNLVEFRDDGSVWVLSLIHI